MVGIDPGLENSGRDFHGRGDHVALHRDLPAPRRVAVVVSEVGGCAGGGRSDAGRDILLDDHACFWWYGRQFSRDRVLGIAGGDSGIAWGGGGPDLECGAKMIISRVSRDPTSPEVPSLGRGVRTTRLSPVRTKHE